MDDEVQVPATHTDVFRSTVRGAEPITTVTTNSSDAGMSLDVNEVPVWDKERFGRLLTEAVEKAFNVHVVEVNTINVRGKVKRMGRSRGTQTSWKKAIVTLQPGEQIQVFEGV